jgi:hypothetical protein
MNQTHRTGCTPRSPGRPRKTGPRHMTGTASSQAHQHEAVAQGGFTPRLLDLEAAAAYLSVSPWTVRDLEAKGVLPRVRVPLPGVESCVSSSSTRLTWTASLGPGRRQRYDGGTAEHQSGEMANTQEGIADTTVREVSQWAVDHAPCITFAQVRALAIKQGLTIRDLVEQFQEEVEHPREVFERVWDKRLGEVVMPYWAVIQWYQKATAPVLASYMDRACACRCGAKVSGRRKWARAACRQRVYRQSQTSKK